jgi:hypothetical protein
VKYPSAQMTNRDSAVHLARPLRYDPPRIAVVFGLLVISARRVIVQPRRNPE